MTERASVATAMDLARESLCTVSEVKRIWKWFSKLDKEGKGFLTLEKLIRSPELRHNPFAARLATLCSEDGGGRLQFDRLLYMFGIFHPRAPLEVKLAWAFAIWDFDGDDKLGASDLRQGLSLLANGVPHATTQEVAADRDVTSNPRMFEPEAPARGNRRHSSLGDLLTAQDISQILHRIGTEVEPASAGISFEEFCSVVSGLPDFAANFHMNF